MGHTSLWPARLATLNDCERRTLRCHRIGITRPCDIARVLKISPSSVALAIETLMACGLIRRLEGEADDEPDPTPEEQSAIEARIARLRRVKIACRRQYADSGVPDDVLDLVLPPEPVVPRRERRRA